MPQDRPDARMPRPACKLCNSHRTLTLFDRNVPCPACSAPQAAQDAAMVHCCPTCGQRDSLKPGTDCAVCRGRQLAREICRPAIASELWTLDAIVNDRRAL
jgi:hypothetical protein